MPTAAIPPPPDAPPAHLPRLFVGNLPPRATDAALTRLLSKFGHAGAVHRHPTRRFAHVSLFDDTTLDRCVAALNRTTWCGGVIVVQRARQHYWHRLTAEWAQKEIKPEGAHGQQGEEEIGEDECADMSLSAKPFDGMGKGTHTVLDFPDVEEADAITPGDDKLHAEHVDSHLLSDDDGVPTPPTTSFSRATDRPTAPKSATLDSTLQLFGLADAGPSAPAPMFVEKPRAQEETLRGGRPKKRARSVQSEQELERAEMAAHKPELIDLEQEKQTALLVLSSMFGDGKKDGDFLLQYRRLGLFRKLQTEEAREMGAKQEQGGAKIVSKLSKQRKEKRARGKPPEDNTGSAECELSLNTKGHRRAGLYKKLVVVPPRQATDDE